MTVHVPRSATGHAIAGAKLPASIEITPRQVNDTASLDMLFPKGTLVYIPDVGTDSTRAFTDAARRIGDAGYVAVPHFAARRLTTRAAFDDRIKALSEEAGVKQALVIGGGLEQPVGEFGSSLELLETGMFDRCGFEWIAIAGHPEGTPDFSDSMAEEALLLKQAFAQRSGTQMRIVTQFGFDPMKAVTWADGLSACGVNLPVHIGIAGPAKLPTLVKYAVMCGVGNSIDFLKKQAGAVSSLLTGPSPELVVEPIERHVASNPQCPIEQLHIFPFGGLKKSSAWLVERGSWHHS